MAKVAKYTPEMVAVITAAAEAGPLNAERAAEIASHPLFVEADITARGVIAKVRTMGLTYEKKEKVSKDGAPVATKEALASRVAMLVGVSELKSLAKAEKRDLRILVDALAASAAETAVA